MGQGMTTPPGANVDTSGAVGNPGPIPLSAQYAAGVKDTTEMGAGGSITARPNPPGATGTLDTEGVYGPNQPAAFSPVSTLIGAAGVKDTTQGFAANMANPVYRAPALAPSGTIKDTGNAQGFTAAIPAENYPWITGMIETASFGAPTGNLVTKTDAGVIDVTTPVTTTAQGIFTNTIAVRKTTGNVLLVLGTDYTITRLFSADKTKAEIRRVGASATVLNGDAITVTYTYGDVAYWGSHDPTAVPPAPVIGTAVAMDRAVKVVWTNGALGEGDDIDGYIIQNDFGGTRYGPGGILVGYFETVVSGTPYKFRVAAFNERGIGVFSAWSNVVTPLNYDEVPPAGLDPKNTVNPIYNADGSIVAGTGLGA